MHGVVSLETLARTARASQWPDAMPDYDTDPDGYRALSGRHAQAVRPGGRPPARHARQSARQSRSRRGARGAGHARDQHVPGPPVHRAWSSTWRTPRTDRLVLLRARTCGCTRSACSSRPSRSSAAICPTPTRRRRCVRLLDAGALTVHPPVVHRGTSWPKPPGASTRTATPARSRSAWARRAALDGARTARAGLRGVGLALRRRATVRVRLDPVRPGRADARRAGHDRLAARQRPRPARCSTTSSARSTRIEARRPRARRRADGRRHHVRGRRRHPPAPRLRAAPRRWRRSRARAQRLFAPHRAAAGAR